MEEARESSRMSTVDLGYASIVGWKFEDEESC